MRIQCPGCDAAYEVPEAQMRPGRSVRCVRCERQWQPAGDLARATSDVPKARQVAEATADAGDPRASAELEVSAAPAVAAVPLEPAAKVGVIRLRQSAAPVTAAVDVVRGHLGLRRRGLFVSTPLWGSAWTASLIVLAMLLLAAMNWRTTIMQAWPPSIRIYTALGALPPQT